MRKLFCLFAFVLVCNVSGAQDDLNDGVLDSFNKAYMDGENERARNVIIPFAQKGNATAMYGMALTYESENTKMYFHWLTKAAESGHSDAQGKLGLAYITGNHVECNCELGLKWLKKSAERSVQANYFLGQLFLYGDYGVPKDLSQAREFFEIASDNGHPLAMTQQATFLLRIDKKTDEAKLLLEKAMDAGEKEHAPVLLADDFYKENEDKWFRLYRIAAENGSDKAQCSIGDCFLDGKVVDVDYNEALKWYQRAAEQGNPNAQFRLGECYKKLFSKTLDERYLRHYIKWTHKAGEKKLGTYSYNEEGYLEYVDPFKEFYEEGYLNARSYSSYEQWHKEVVEHIAKGSDVDLEIPIVKRNTNMFALVISNEDYDYEARVPYALNDGHSFVNYCINIFGIPEDRIHFIKNASFNKIKYELNWLKQMCQQYNASCYIYYAGHGVPASDLSAAYLLPVDGYSSDVSTGLNLDELYRELGDITSTIFIDACFSGAHRSGGMLENNRSVRITPNMSAPRNNTIVISACQSNETAYGDDLEEHGIFTYYLLKCIKESRGNIRLGDLYTQVRSNVYQAANKDHKVQTPSIFMANGKADIWQNFNLVR